jgi:hypothetical protein
MLNLETSQGTGTGKVIFWATTLAIVYERGIKNPKNFILDFQLQPTLLLLVVSSDKSFMNKCR